MYQQQQVQQPSYQNQMMPSVQQLNGKFVNSFNEVTANDVNMNGQPSLFVKSDLSEIEARAWTPNGMINRVVFKPVENANPSNNTNDATQTDYKAFGDVLGALQNEVKSLSDKIDKFIGGNVYESVSDDPSNEKSTTVSSKPRK